MADDSGRSYLKKLAKNRLRGGGVYSTSMTKKNFKRPPMKNADANTKPDTPRPSPINAGNRGTAWYTHFGPGNQRGPTAMRRSHEAPQDKVRMRKVT